MAGERSMGCTVLKADTGNLTYFCCGECSKTLDKALRPGPGGRLAATEKFAHCNHCKKDVLPTPTFLLPLTVLPTDPLRSNEEPRKVIALGSTVASLFGCSAQEYRTKWAHQPTLPTLLEKLLCGRRFWLSTKQNRNRKRQRGGMQVATDDIVTALQPLEPGPPLLARMEALLSSHTVAQTPAAETWVNLQGAALVYKYCR